MTPFRIPATALAAAVLALTCSLPAAAFEWPWAHKTEVRYNYCKGFTVAALGSKVPDLSRTNLWLAWNVINRDGLPPDAAWNEDYNSGVQAFLQWQAEGNVDQLKQVADRECALGRN